MQFLFHMKEWSSYAPSGSRVSSRWGIQSPCFPIFVLEPGPVVFCRLSYTGPSQKWVYICGGNTFSNNANKARKRTKSKSKTEVRSAGHGFYQSPVFGPKAPKPDSELDFEVQVQTKVRSELDFEVQVQVQVQLEMDFEAQVRAAPGPRSRSPIPSPIRVGLRSPSPRPKSDSAWPCPKDLRRRHRVVVVTTSYL
jgi:hypothetical protein